MQQTKALDLIPIQKSLPKKVFLKYGKFTSGVSQGKEFHNLGGITENTLDLLPTNQDSTRARPQRRALLSEEFRAQTS